MSAAWAPLPVEPVSPLDWMADAACAQTDPELFNPPKGGSSKSAKRICAGCEVRAQCLAWALEHEESRGIWGGLSERQRARLKRGAA